MNWVRGIPDQYAHTNHWGLCVGITYDQDPKAQVWYSPGDNCWFYTCAGDFRKTCDSLEDGMKRADRDMGRSLSQTDLLFT